MLSNRIIHDGEMFHIVKVNCVSNLNYWLLVNLNPRHMKSHKEENVTLNCYVCVPKLFTSNVAMECSFGPLKCRKFQGH